MSSGFSAKNCLAFSRALPELLAVEGVPSPGLLDDAEVGADVEQRALTADALAVHDVELGLPERRSHLVLHDLDPRAATDDLDAVFDGLDAADVEPHRWRRNFSAPAGRCFRGAEHYPYLFPELVDEEADGVGRRPVEVGGELAQRLTHEASLKADMRVAHLTFDLGPRSERSHRVDDDDVERARADAEHVGDLERLLTGVGLRDQELVDVDADGLRVHGDPSGARRRCRRRCRRCAATRRRHAWRASTCPTTLGRPRRRPSREPTHTEGDVDVPCARGDRLDVHRALLAHPHDRALAELLVDRSKRHLECLVALRCVSFRGLRHRLRRPHRLGMRPYKGGRTFPCPDSHDWKVRTAVRSRNRRVGDPFCGR